MCVCIASLLTVADIIHDHSDSYQLHLVLTYIYLVSTKIKPFRITGKIIGLDTSHTHAKCASATVSYLFILLDSYIEITTRMQQPFSSSDI